MVVHTNPIEDRAQPQADEGIVLAIWEILSVASVAAATMRDAVSIETPIGWAGVVWRPLYRVRRLSRPFISGIGSDCS